MAMVCALIHRSSKIILNKCSPRSGVHLSSQLVRLFSWSRWPSFVPSGPQQAVNSTTHKLWLLENFVHFCRISLDGLFLWAKSLLAPLVL